MTITVKAGAPLAIPASVRRRARIRTGDRLEFEVYGGVITIVPKTTTAADEDRPDQRRKIQKQLAQGLDDVRAGRVSKRFDSVDEMLISLKQGAPAPRRKKRRER